MSRQLGVTCHVHVTQMSRCHTLSPACRFPAQTHKNIFRDRGPTRTNPARSDQPARCFKFHPGATTASQNDRPSTTTQKELCDVHLTRNLSPIPPLKVTAPPPGRRASAKYFLVELMSGAMRAGYRYLAHGRERFVVIGMGGKHYRTSLKTLEQIALFHEVADLDALRALAKTSSH